MFNQSRCPPIHAADEVFVSLFNTICATSVPSLLLASIDTFSAVLARSSQSSYNILLAVCASTNSVCGIVLKSRHVTPSILFNVETHVNEPELSVRILQLVESIIEKLSVHHLTSEKGLGTNLDSFICYMVAITTHILFHYRGLSVLNPLMTHALSILTSLVPGTCTVPHSVIEPLVAEILTLVTNILTNNQHSTSIEESVYALLAVSWHCLSHIFSVYQMALDGALDIARDLACKTILTDLSSIITCTEVATMCGAVGFRFLNALSKDPSGLFEAYITGPLSILQTILNHRNMQTSDLVANSFFCNQAVSAVISNLVVYGCCLDRYDLHEWMTSPFNGALLDISGGKTNECCDFIVECFFGFQGLLIKNFMTTFTTAVTTFSALTEESTEYLTTSLTLDSILTVFGAIWPSLTIDIDHLGTDSYGERGTEKECGTPFLFEDAYGIFDSLFRACSIVLRRSVYCPPTVSQPASLGNLLFLRRLALLLTYVSAAILPEFVDSCFSLLLCFLQGPMLTTSPSTETGSLETYMGLQVLAANAISTIVTDMSSADLQREALLSSNHTLNILIAGIDILTAVFSDSSRLPSDGYLDVHTRLVESLLSFLNSEQDNMKLERSFFSSLTSSLGSLVVRASNFSDRNSALRRLLNCYREVLLINVYALNLECDADLSASLELLRLIYPVYMDTILPLINSVLIDSVLEIVRAVLNLLNVFPLVDNFKDCLEATALILFQLASVTKQSVSSRELMYTHTTVTSLIITMVQLYPKYMVLEGQAVTANFLSYLFSFTEDCADINGFYQTFSILIESLVNVGELAQVLYKGTQFTSNLSRIRQFMDQYAYLPSDTPLMQITSLMAMELPISAILIYLSLRCAYTSITADSHRSILLRAYCYAAPLVYATDTCVSVLGNADAFLTGLSDFVCNLLPCLSDALFSKRIATVLQMFITLDSYTGPQASNIHTALSRCMPQLAQTIQQFKHSNRDETDPTYTAIVRALENLVDRRTEK
ncbi:Hypothetical protein GLP15_1597 [Giardia lamblia P15]|uniref:Uncharacterized protein n=1 Tax=Giardia intestinalis (strain P15) TaxID=658858 RepID=E1EX76_GIAIA|nr:Hypothetical protein GLP15_1597 [Giardia lamblia P15]